MARSDRRLHGERGDDLGRQEDTWAAVRDRLVLLPSRIVRHRRRREVLGPEWCWNRVLPAGYRSLAASPIGASTMLVAGCE